MADIPEFEIIVNFHSGLREKEETLRLLAGIFESQGRKARIQVARSGEELVKMAKAAAQGGSPALVAGGGDGTINAVASQIVGTGKKLGVLPLGTLNHFAKDIRIPMDIEEAARVIIGGRTAEIDVGEVNGLLFLNNSSLGLYPSLVRDREAKQRRGFAKWLAFLGAAAVTWATGFPFHKSSCPETMTFRLTMSSPDSSIRSTSTGATSAIICDPFTATKKSPSPASIRRDLS